MNAFVIGNGTASGASSSANTVIDGFNFVPLAGVPAFTTGSCIFINYAYYIAVKNCDFYGTNASYQAVLFNAITVFQTTTFYIKHSWFSFFNGAGIQLSGTITSDNSLRTVDGYLDELEFTWISGHCIDMLSGCAGIVMNKITAQSYAQYGIHIATNPVGAAGQNIFIVQPDLEADRTSGGIWLEYAERVQIVGGWIGVASPSSWALKFDTNSDSCVAIGVAIAFGSVAFYGPSNSLLDCEITGDGSTFGDGVTVYGTATDTKISDCRIRQLTGAGIRFDGNPPRCMVSDCHFKQVGIDIAGQAFLPQAFPPVINGCQSDAQFDLTASATMQLSCGRAFYQFVGDTAVSQFSNLGQGQRITVQAGAGGITLISAEGGNLQLKQSPRIVPQYSTISFVNDGQNWFEDGSNF